jgi:hypothetical protein
MAYAHIKSIRLGKRGFAFVDLDTDGVAIAQVLEYQPMSAAELEDTAWPEGRKVAIDKGCLLEIDWPRVFSLEALAQLAHGESTHLRTCA